MSKIQIVLQIFTMAAAGQSGALSRSRGHPIGRSRSDLIGRSKRDLIGWNRGINNSVWSYMRNKDLVLQNNDDASMTTMQILTFLARQKMEKTSGAENSVKNFAENLRKLAKMRQKLKNKQLDARRMRRFKNYHQ